MSNSMEISSLYLFFYIKYVFSVHAMCLGKNHFPTQSHLNLKSHSLLRPPLFCFPSHYSTKMADDQRLLSPKPTDDFVIFLVLPAAFDQLTFHSSSKCSLLLALNTIITLFFLSIHCHLLLLFSTFTFWKVS